MRYLLSLLPILLTGVSFAAERKPNFVFLFADDQRHDAMSVVQKEQGDKGRFPWFQTPHMDRLAASGVRFRNAFVVNALCSPSRACFLTGRYSHANGIWNNTTAFDDKMVTSASLLKAAGYSTGYVGKWHMGTSPNRPGFDWYASFTGQGLYFDAKFLVNGKTESTPDWTDDRSGDYAVRFLERARDPAKPFFLVVGWKAPHGPFDPPKRLDNAFANEKARKTPNFGIKPGFNTHLEGGKQNANGDTVPVNLKYFRAIAGVDENVGKVLDALDRLKLSDDTIVISSSDNGYYLGEHRLGDKRSAYEESMRVPLIIRDPRSKLKGVTRDDLVLNIDLAPTLLEWAGLPVPAEMHGKSWVPLLNAERPKETFRDSFLYEYFRETGGKQDAPNPNLGGYNTPTLTAVRTTTHKLIRYRDRPEWTELFDLKNDPFELKNLANDEAHAKTKESLNAEHDRLLKSLNYHVPKNIPGEPVKTASPSHSSLTVHK